MARARLQRMEPMLVGQDPLSIEKHFLEMITLMHTYTAHIPTVSGIDIALWDLAGKILDKPVNLLLGGPFRDAIRMYSHGQKEQVGDMQDMARMRDWAAEIKQAPEGFTAFKISIDYSLGIPSGRFATTLDPAQIRRIGRGFMNAREAVGDDIEVAVHGHNELDTTSAIQVAHVVEPMRPYFYEDPLPVQYSEGWQALRESTRIPLLIGEKLELTQEFRPFLDRGIADYIHPDLAFAGGITGTKKIADYALLSRRPVALHNVGSLILTYASAHFGSAIHNFFRSESALGRPTRHVEQMSANGAPEVKKGVLTVPSGPGLGFEPNDDYLRGQLEPGEVYWS
jgi:galactonate dehydratase